MRTEVLGISQCAGIKYYQSVVDAEFILIQPFQLFANAIDAFGRGIQMKTPFSIYLAGPVGTGKGQ
jgi:hypothetical protein